MNGFIDKFKEYKNAFESNEYEIDNINELKDQFKLIMDLSTSAYLNALKELKEQQKYTYIASFDLGINYSGYYVEKFDHLSDNYLDFKIVDWRMFSPSSSDDKYKTKKEMFENVLPKLTKFMDSKADLWELCSVFILEKQLYKQNPDSTRIQHFLGDYFRVKYPQTRVLVFPSKEKSRVCIKQSIPGNKLKKWAIAKTLQILKYKGNEELYIKRINTEYHKPEDYADPFLQLRAYKLSTYPAMKKRGCDIPIVDFMTESNTIKVEVNMNLDFDDYQVKDIEKLLKTSYKLPDLKKKCKELGLKGIRKNSKRQELFYKISIELSKGDDDVSSFCVGLRDMKKTDVQQFCNDNAITYKKSYNMDKLIDVIIKELKNKCNHKLL